MLERTIADGRIAAELRLWDAINQQRLVPFIYYGIHDNVDLSSVPWRRGRGYDTDGLSSVLTSSEAWARLVLQELDKHVDELRRGGGTPGLPRWVGAFGLVTRGSGLGRHQSVVLRQHRAQLIVR